MDNYLGGFLGGPRGGTFTEETALLYMHGQDERLKEYDTIDRIIEDVAAGALARGGCAD